MNSTVMSAAVLTALASGALGVTPAQARGAEREVPLRVTGSATVTWSGGARPAR